MTQSEGVPQYDFMRVPPIKPKLFFTERHLIQLALYGTVGCPFTPVSETVYPSAGQLGRWTLHFDVVDLEHLFANGSPWKLLAQELPGMRVRYHGNIYDETDKTWLWVLTDQVIHRHGHDHDLRLGVWPD